jgi:hypothetical protein
METESHEWEKGVKPNTALFICETYAVPCLGKCPIVFLYTYYTRLSDLLFTYIFL